MRPRPALLAALLGVAGAVGVALAVPAADVDVGPAVLAVSARPTLSLSGDTTADLGSLGRAVIDTHDGPVAVRLSMREIHPDVMSAALADGAAPHVRGFDEAALRSGATRYAVAVLVLAVAGGAATAWVVLRRPRMAAVGAASAAAVVMTLAGVTAATFGTPSPPEVHFEGALALAPTVYDDVLVRYDDFVTQVGALTQQFAALQQRVAGAAPGTATAAGATDNADPVVRVLVISDLHLNEAGVAMARQLAEAYDVDLVVNLGDDTDWGTGAESERMLSSEAFDVPYLWVRGNHDSRTTQERLADGGATVLDDDLVTVAGLTFYGIGDPTFTPKKSAAVIDAGEQAYKKEWSAREFLPRYRDARDTARATAGDIDVLLVHDESMAYALEPGEGPPLILSGHRHAHADHSFRGSRSVVMGSTGGAGLRSFDSPGGSNPNQAGVFYFDPGTGRATGYDLFTFRPLDANRFTMQRVLIPTDGAGEESQLTGVDPAPAVVE